VGRDGASLKSQFSPVVAHRGKGCQTIGRQSEALAPDGGSGERSSAVLGHIRCRVPACCLRREAVVVNSSADPVQYLVQHDPDPQLRTFIVRSLVEYNGRRSSPENDRPLAIFARRGETVIGGAIGYTHWNWLFVSHLWVRDEDRGCGVGQALLERMEDEGRNRGATRVHLDTFDFQALPFYQRLGYEEFGRLEDYPPGHSRHFLWRALAWQLTRR
jgi:GNAT superfamily N-acetyltransferase